MRSLVIYFVLDSTFLAKKDQKILETRCEMGFGKLKLVVLIQAHASL